MKSLLLVGAGEHARVLADLVVANGYMITAYVDPSKCNWLDGVRWFKEDQDVPADTADAFIIGFGAVTPEGLERRLRLQSIYCERGHSAATLVHETAVISPSAELGAGTMVLAAGIVQPAAKLGESVIVNSGAIVEHDCVIGDGAHLAPGATVLGQVTVGRAAMVGAGAVVLQRSSVRPATIVKAASLFRDKFSTL